jgi:hypothetical protein
MRWIMRMLSRVALGQARSQECSHLGGCARRPPRHDSPRSGSRGAPAGAVQQREAAHPCACPAVRCTCVCGAGALPADHTRSDLFMAASVCLQLSGQRVLTMEFVDGCRLTDIALLQGAYLLNKVAPYACMRMNVWSVGKRVTAQKVSCTSLTLACAMCGQRCASDHAMLPCCCWRRAPAPFTDAPWLI